MDFSIRAGAVNGSTGGDIADNTITITSADSNVHSVQRRVSSQCSGGSSIHIISNTGSVICEPDSQRTFGIESDKDLPDFGGTQPKTLFLGNANGQRFCSLSGMFVENTDTDNETATCRVIIDSGSNWRLQATLGQGGDDDANIRCFARSFTIQ